MDDHITNWVAHVSVVGKESREGVCKSGVENPLIMLEGSVLAIPYSNSRERLVEGKFMLNQSA
jgi:hypothetical protein